MLAQAAKDQIGAARLLLPARVFPSPFSSRRFLPAWHVAIVGGSIQLLFNTSNNSETHSLEK